MKNRIFIYTTIIFLLISYSELFTQTIPKVTILNNPAPGYYYFDIIQSSSFQLFDNYGELVHHKETIPQKRKKMLENGLISEFDVNKYLIYNENLELIDSIKNPTNYTIDLHDFVALRNGNYLMLLNHKVQKDLSSIVEGGQEDALIINNLIVETDGRGKIYWSWSALDYLEITDVTSAVDLTMNMIDLFHINSVFEDSNGNLLISIRHYDEVALVNKQTKQFIWRFGGQNCKNNQYTILNDEVDGFKGFSHQHTVSILENGNILLFDNGNLKPNKYSRAVEYSINHQTKTATKVWEYRANPDVYIFAMGSAYRLENGNTLIGWSKFGFTEVRQDKTVTLEAISDNPNGIYRVQKTNLKQKYKSININSNGTYQYNSTNNVTGISIKVESISGIGGNTHIQKHFYPPHRGDYANTDFLSILPYRWVYSNDGGINTLSGELSLDVGSVKDINFPQGIVIYIRESEDKGIFQRLETTYDENNNQIKAKIDGFGEFVLAKTTVKGPKLLYPQNNVRGVSAFGELKWEKIFNTQKYHIQLSSNNSFNQKIIDTLAPAKEIFQYAGLDYLRQYFWRVRAIAGDDTTEWSETYNFRTNLATPKILQPINNFIGFRNNDFVVWDSVTYSENYQFQLSQDKSFQNLINNSWDIKKNSIKVSGLGYNTRYFCRVRAIASADTSEWSSYVTFTTVLPSPKLITPTNNSKDIEIPSQLKWTKISDSEEYHIEISEDKRFGPEFTLKIIIADTSVRINELEPGTEYFWKVQAVRPTDTSDWSEIFTFYTKITDTTAIELQSPQIQYPKNNDFAIYIDGIIKWSKVEKAKGYRIKLTQIDKGIYKEFDVKSAGTFQTSLDELEYNTKYEVAIKATSGFYESKWSDPIVFTTELKPPTIANPVNLSKEVPAKGRFEFQYDYPQFDLHLQVSQETKFGDLIIDKKGKNDNITEYSLGGETTYYARLIQFSDSNRSRWSDTVQFTTSKINSTSISDDYEVDIFQNDKNNLIHIYLNKTNNIDRIIIYNILGNAIFESRIEANVTEISTGYFPKGIYILVLKSLNNQVIKNQILYLY